MALKRWEKLLLNVGLDIIVQSDSMTALAVTQKYSNSSKALNFLGGVLAIQMESMGLAALTPTHIPGTANKEADYLSRPETWASTELPKELAGIQIETPAGRPRERCTLEPLATDAEGWGEATALAAPWANRP